MLVTSLAILKGLCNVLSLLYICNQLYWAHTKAEVIFLPRKYYEPKCSMEIS